ncbi:SphA family protein [Litorisediminicola beolgyonensis]|uniref:Transporter n=1 Tax=Litorisediminicola beolgyonensis TaxID=1173614 RepID=A0ABW3ZGF2_9RHOB
MNRTLLFAAALLAATPALAREPGTPAVMPSGATMGVPVGANFPVPGFYLSSRSALVRGKVYDDTGTDTGQSLDVNVTAVQLHWTPGVEILGGTYRAMGIMAFQDLDFAVGGTSVGKNTSVSDLTISPLNIHWMVAPGVFTTVGLGFSLPLGEFEPAGPGAGPNGGLGAPALALNAGFSYLRDGWNLSADVNYFIHGENEDTGYRSGNEVLANFTAMRGFGESGWSAGAIGYWRDQVSDDKNNGTAYGGFTAGRVKETAIGVAVAKRFGPTEIYADYTWNTHAENTVGADTFRLNITFPLGGKK